MPLICLFVQTCHKEVRGLNISYALDLVQCIDVFQDKELSIMVGESIAITSTVPFLRDKSDFNL